jgi:hypothetical protein
MARQKKQLTDAFNQFSQTENVKTKDKQTTEKKEETKPFKIAHDSESYDGTSNSNTKTETKDETQKGNNENVTSNVIQNNNTTVEHVKQNLLNKYEEKTNRATVEDTHTRSTFLFRNDLSDRLDKLAKKKKRGFKTLFINDAIEALLDEMEK